MADWYRVLRPFGGPNGERQEPGTVVDGSGWRNAQKLVAAGKLAPASPPEGSPANPVGRSTPPDPIPAAPKRKEVPHG